MSRTSDDSLWSCPEAITHGPADTAGKCPWCRRKIASATPAPKDFAVSDLTLAYGRHYDPDFDVLTHDQIRQRYEMGQQT